MYHNPFQYYEIHIIQAKYKNIYAKSKKLSEYKQDSVLIDRVCNLKVYRMLFVLGVVINIA